LLVRAANGPLRTGAQASLVRAANGPLRTGAQASLVRAASAKVLTPPPTSTPKHIAACGLVVSGQPAKGLLQCHLPLQGEARQYQL
jgi:hypothetical protein